MDKYNPHQVLYSKCIIRNVITAQEWTNPFEEHKFSITFTPQTYNYNDYKMVWYGAFLLQPNVHSWFFNFHEQCSNTFLVWFYRWWTMYLKIIDYRACRWFDRFTYWKDYDPCILQFVQKVIPDVHICPHDYFSYHLQFLQSSTQVLQCIQNTCLQFVHYKVNYEGHCTCQRSAHYDVTCTLLHKYGQLAQQIE